MSRLTQVQYKCGHSQEVEYELDYELDSHDIKKATAWMEGDIKHKESRKCDECLQNENAKRVGLKTEELWDILKQLKRANQSQLEAISFMADENMEVLMKGEMSHEKTAQTVEA